MAIPEGLHPAQPSSQTSYPRQALPQVVGPSQSRPWWAPLLRGGIRPLLLAGDLLACVVAGALSPSRSPLAIYFAIVLVGFLCVVDLYRSRLTLSLLDDLPRLVQAWLMAVALMEVGAQIILGEFVGIQLAAVAGVTLVTFRVLSYQLVRSLRRSGLVSHPTVIVGADQTGEAIVRQLNKNPQCGLKTLGFLDSYVSQAGDTRLPAPLLGGPWELSKVLRTYEPRALIIAHTSMTENDLVAVIRACHRHHCEMFILPRLYQVTHVGDDMDALGDMPLIRLRRAAYRSWGWRWKRLLDIAGSLAAIVLLSPILLACAIVVRLEGGPGVIFRQERVGVDGRRFELLKFRSLRPVNDLESQTNWNIAHDSRVSVVGRTLRRYSLDELPQLFNILRGDMSLVGPRPERPYFVAEFDRLYGDYGARHRVPCGLTGWAQVHGLRGNTSIEDRARFDNFYIENWSLWLDLKILLLTVVSVFKSPGA
jgi:exopolysaccharide biosynthesis polyprenyl glycosylphosphotransferase